MDWRLLALLSALFASLTAIFSKLGVKDVNANLALAIRVTIILALTWGIVLCSGTLPQLRQLNARHWLFLVLSAVATGLSWMFYFMALQKGDVSKVAPIDKLSVVITIAIGVLFLHEAFSLELLLGGLLITAGSLVLLL